MRTKQRRIVFWTLLACCPLLFVWAANYFVHPMRILFVVGAVIAVAFVIHPGIDKRR